MSAWRARLTTAALLSLLLLLLLASGVLAEHVWVVQVDEGGDGAARQIASSHGLEFHGQIPHLRNKFVFKLGANSATSGQPQSRLIRMKRSAASEHQTLHRSLQRHPKVTWVSYQTELTRQKRDFVPFDQLGGATATDTADASTEDRRSSSPTGRGGGSLDQRAVSDFSPSELNHRADRIFVDPLWPQQWYLHDTRAGPHQPKLDLHVIPAWRRNLTGRGVVVAIVDDGLERDHPDLAANYDQRASYNFNSDTPDPMPRYVNIEEERHGTRCAGEVAMSANNSHCGVGVAFNARIGGIKILDGGISDLLEARGLSHAMDHVDVYSASWGPNDDGQSMEAPGPLASEALQAGIERGRRGLGVLYVWASGNGGAFGDNCNCDGYASSVFTIAVSSANQRLLPPWYSEHCSATLATTFSSGATADQQVVSTDLRHRCTTEFTGTSASAPFASGIIALLLEANTNLTWRDVQHVIVWSAEVAPLLGNPGWQRNAAGHKYHHQFGFGLFNAAAMTSLVDPATWRRVPAKDTVQLDGWHCQEGRRLRRSKSIQCGLTVAPDVEEQVRYLEHVQLRVNMTYPERGALAIYITSASGTRSQLLTRRKHDTANSGLPSWAFMTVHFWGENPTGKWIVSIEDQSDRNDHHGTLEEMQLILHGTAEAPDYRIRAGGYRKYNHEYNNVKNMKQRQQQRSRKSSTSRQRHRRASRSAWDDSTIDYSKQVQPTVA